MRQKLIGIGLILLSGIGLPGCCSWCEHHCPNHQPAPVAACQPCAPACCAAAPAYPAPAGYQPAPVVNNSYSQQPPQNWTQPRPVVYQPATGCMCPQ